MNSTKGFFLFIAAVFTVFIFHNAYAQGDGLLVKDGRQLFPIGIYEMPKTDMELKAMADAGINLVRCGGKEDLDRAAKFGIQGWVPLGVHQGATDELREKIESVVNHPALAIWEGPDEIIWNFTAYSGLYRDKKVYSRQGEWWEQTSLVVDYSEEQAKTILPNIKAGIQLVRKLDKKNRQFWINEARYSDLKFVRQYLDWIDITGCDHYPISLEKRTPADLAVTVERWKQAGQGKPVWMVLQAFSWHELGGRYSERGVTYPTFAESRFMAYDCIARGAGGVLYWGSMFLKSEEFRRSLYAVTGELAELQPFLTAPEIQSVSVRPVLGITEEEKMLEKKDNGLRVTARRSGREWIVIVVNEADVMRMGVEVSGLDYLNGMELVELYGNEKAVVRNGEIITRMKPVSVKVFATSRAWEAVSREGRDYGM